MKRDYKAWIAKFSLEHTEERERTWKAAQMNLMEQLCDDLDEDLEDLFESSRHGAVGSNAVLTKYISSLRQEYKHIKKILEDRKNYGIME